MVLTKSSRPARPSGLRNVLNLEDDHLNMSPAAAHNNHRYVEEILPQQARKPMTVIISQMLRSIVIPGSYVVKVATNDARDGSPPIMASIGNCRPSKSLDSESPIEEKSSAAIVNITQSLPADTISPREPPQQEADLVVAGPPMRPMIPRTLLQRHLHMAYYRPAEVPYQSRRLPRIASSWPQPIIKGVDPQADLIDARAMFGISDDFEEWLKRETECLRASIIAREMIFEAQRKDIPLPCSPNNAGRDSSNLRRDQLERGLYNALIKALVLDKATGRSSGVRTSQAERFTGARVCGETDDGVLRAHPKDFELNKKQLKARKDMWAAAVAIKQVQHQVVEQRRGALQASRVQNQQSSATKTSGGS
ncbi:hypothetical protein BD626DRAFT_578089 [Schizophyllum amplum]|uniref:Uncharacterized protein n=1 Tax=Schizophyllum amplum TaxID=97359 RepID=A0A550BS65_9AGAR|nr:hypothetical protein BD626DRAFT_578089 [Auriculariopsis ampla]